ncbi:hypothetical protein DERF_012162 [Dermatophagoides farinae]|uniref:Uncharacterized protein n=1 Tax=Dermatophagoides farinae TaxID=6954 RepID=A0A922HRL5_DERFA|nr:hypothetical protein DERF_012162 [Dermatophagoides farinae]
MWPTIYVIVKFDIHFVSITILIKYSKQEIGSDHILFTGFFIDNDDDRFSQTATATAVFCRGERCQLLLLLFVFH